MLRKSFKITGNYAKKQHNFGTRKHMFKNVKTNNTANKIDLNKNTRDDKIKIYSPFFFKTQYF